jgi:hypothetical protein
VGRDDPDIHPVEAEAGEGDLEGTDPGDHGAVLAAEAALGAGAALCAICAVAELWATVFVCAFVENPNCGNSQALTSKVAKQRMAAQQHPIKPIQEILFCCFVMDRASCFLDAKQNSHGACDEHQSFPFENQHPRHFCRVL